MNDAASRARNALSAGLVQLTGPGIVDAIGYTAKLDDNLVTPLDQANVRLIRQEFGAGAGGELAGARPKLHAAHSSAALAINVFAPWRNDAKDLPLLPLGDERGVRSMTFEFRCPTGLRGTPPHLDLVAEGPARVLAVESKCIEYLTKHDGSPFRDSYKKRVSKLAHGSWQSIYKRMVDGSAVFHHLDAAQLVKHYLGLKNTFPDVPVTLFYIYWEPENPGAERAFANHRAEVESFARGLADPRVRFEAMSYPELWSRWERVTEPAWVTAHVAALRERYLVRI